MHTRTPTDCTNCQCERQESEHRKKQTTQEGERKQVKKVYVEWQCALLYNSNVAANKCTPLFAYVAHYIWFALIMTSLNGLSLFWNHQQQQQKNTPRYVIWWLQFVACIQSRFVSVWETHSNYCKNCIGFAKLQATEFPFHIIIAYWLTNFNRFARLVSLKMGK